MNDIVEYVKKSTLRCGRCSRAVCNYGCSSRTLVFDGDPEMNAEMMLVGAQGRISYLKAFLKPHYNALSLYTAKRKELRKMIEIRMILNRRIKATMFRNNKEYRRKCIEEDMRDKDFLERTEYLLHLL